MSASEETGLWALFNEVGILHQLASALFVKTLPDGVHIAHFAILNHMVRLGDDKSPVQLASAMQVTKPTMTHSLKVLEARGLIRMIADTRDARGKRVLLTAEGRDFRQHAIAALEGALGGMAEQLDAARLALAVGQLREVRRILDAARSEKAGSPQH